MEQTASNMMSNSTKTKDELLNKSRVYDWNRKAIFEVLDKSYISKLNDLKKDVSDSNLVDLYKHLFEEVVDNSYFD